MVSYNNSVDATSNGVQSLNSGVWSGSSLTQYSTLTGGSSNAIVSLGVASNGQLVIGSTGTTPVLSTLTPGAGVTITNGEGSITIAAATEGLTWSAKLIAFNAVAENGYFVTNALGVATLPSGASTGTTIKFSGTVLGLVVTANTGDTIYIGSASSSSGGTATSVAAGASITLTYYSTGTGWYASGVQGNWTLA